MQPIARRSRGSPARVGTPDRPQPNVTQRYWERKVENRKATTEYDDNMEFPTAERREMCHDISVPNIQLCSTGSRRTGLMISFKSTA
jgi:hypothetical protein